MKEISAILLVIDGDHNGEALLTEVLSIATEGQSRVTILSITEQAAGESESNVAVSNLRNWEAKVRSMQLESLCFELSAKGLQVDVQYATGKPYLEVIRCTLSGEYDIVVKPAKRSSGIGRLLLGGTDIQLLSLCPLPVWIFQPKTSQSLRKVAVALDLQPDDSERQALARKVLIWGSRIAHSIGAELHVIHAWSIYREDSLRAGFAQSNVVDALSASKEQLHRNWLEDALQQVDLGNAVVHDHLVKGEARKLIPDVVEEFEIDLLAMGTVGRTGIPGFFIGNTADSVLRNVTASVLAIKPDSFSTPVALKS